MKRPVAILGVLASVLSLSAVAQFYFAYLSPSVVAAAPATDPNDLAWAYGVTMLPPVKPRNAALEKVDDAKAIAMAQAFMKMAKGDRPLRVPGSEATFTPVDIADLYNPPDWFPNDHPAAPDVALHGRKPELLACGYCHLPNGQGRPENASLAGLPAAYIVEQMQRLKDGSRRSRTPDAIGQLMMDALARQATAAEVQAAATYFSSMKMKPWIKVVEAPTVPKTSEQAGLVVPSPDGGTEPIGNRIVEVPQQPALAVLRDPRSGFVAYVPPDSIAKGKSLVMDADNGRTIPCASCHGPELRGTDTIPGIVGRSPTYVVRALYDFQSGTRHSPDEQMASVVANLKREDLVAIAAYLASRSP